MKKTKKRVDMKLTDWQDVYPLTEREKNLKPGEYLDYRTAAFPGDEELAKAFFNRPGGLRDRRRLARLRKSSPDPKSKPAKK